MGQQGNFGYKLPEAIRGEIGSTSINIIRTGTATADIDFGKVVELTYRTQTDIDLYGPNGVREYTDLLDSGLPLLGVAVYVPSSSNGKKTQYKYLTDTSVAIMTRGDVYVEVTQGSLCLMGDPCYLAKFGPTWVVTDQVTARRVGTFAETKEATADNSILIHFDSKIPQLGP